MNLFQGLRGRGAADLMADTITMLRFGDPVDGRGNAVENQAPGSALKILCALQKCTWRLERSFDGIDGA